MNSFTTFKNTKIHYKLEGRGQTVVLLHGFLENLSMWDSITSELKEYFQVLRVDLLGHGLTENIGYIHGMKDMALYVKAVIDLLDIKEYSLIGHSMGGYVALELAKNDEARLKGLGLFHSTAFDDSDIKVQGRIAAINQVKVDVFSFVENAIPALFRSESTSEFTEEINQVLIQAHNTSQQSVIAALHGMKDRENSIEFWRNFKLKKLIQFGTFDNALNFFDNSMHFTGLSNTTVVELPVAHMGHIEAKAESIKAIKDWLEI